MLINSECFCFPAVVQESVGDAPLQVERREEHRRGGVADNVASQQREDGLQESGGSLPSDRKPLQNSKGRITLFYLHAAVEATNTSDFCIIL